METAIVRSSLPPKKTSSASSAGDLLGMIIAHFLYADAVVVLISSNNTIDRGFLAYIAEPKMKIISRFSPPEASIEEVEYHRDQIIVYDPKHATLEVTKPHTEGLGQIRQELQTVFSAEAGFAPIARLNYTDGDVAHFRPSGNADELRIYSIVNTQERADAIASHGVEEPDGLLRRLERMV